MRLFFLVSMGNRLLAFALLLLLPGIAWTADQPSIVLVTLDTVRADRMGFLGSNRGLTPQLDALAREGVVFTRAYAHAPLTTVSHATVFTGTFPQFHKVNDFGIPLPQHLPALAELLRQRGYCTAAFVGSLILDPFNGMAPGFDRGFDTYDASFRTRQRGDDRYKTMERRAGEVITRAVVWLEKNSSAPFFLWVHLFDPHDPYEAPAAYARRFPKSPYNGEIAYTDAAVGGLFAALRTRGLYDNTLITVFSDHGEGLGAHGENTHGIFLYDETIHVPLLMKFPGGRYAGQHVTTPVGLVDIAPSVLEIVGLPIPFAMQGQSLVRVVAGAVGGRPVYSETNYPRRAFGWSPLASWRTGKHLYIHAPRPELYDVAADPGARNNLFAADRPLAKRLGAEMEGFRRRSGGTGSEPVDQPVDPRIVEKLSALGYVAGSSRTAAFFATGIDPKDKVEVANLMHDAVHAIEDGRYSEVAPLFRRVVTSDPQIFIAQFYLGMTLARERNYAEAIPHLRRATELLPDAGLAHYELGVALYETGDWKTAAAHFQIAVGFFPKWADAHFSLASVWARTDHVLEAIQHLQTALQINADHYRANLLLGRIYTLQGKAADGLPYLEKAAASPSASGEAHSFLADAYARLGRTEEAQRARTRAAQLGSPRRSP